MSETRGVAGVIRGTGRVLSREAEELFAEWLALERGDQNRTARIQFIRSLTDSEREALEVALASSSPRRH